MRIALGLEKVRMLDDFAQTHGALTHRDWGGEDWRLALNNLASKPATEIYWNLTEVNVPEGLLRASRLTPLSDFGGTDWELLQFRNNDDWLRRCVWYRDGQLTDEPEEMRS